MLIFNLYAEQAQSFNQETEEELSKILSYNIYIQAIFIRDKKDKFYGPTYEMPAGVTSTVDLVKQINTYFELVGLPMPCRCQPPPPRPPTALRGLMF
jgi:hypothetical protein